MEALITWFRERPVWIQEAFARLLKNGTLKNDDIDGLLALCKKEAGLDVDGLATLPTPTITAPQCTPQTTAGTLRLTRISDIRGINALSPRNPLIFHPTSMTIIFGPNGSGKSGYARALRYAAGARKCNEPLANVFGVATEQRGCQFTYTIDGQENTLAWSINDGCVEPLDNLAIFDSHCANIYVNEENALTYEPFPLPLFTELSKTCDTISVLLQGEVNTLKSVLPQLPAAHAQTQAATWFGTLSARTIPTDIDAQCRWNADDELLLAELNQRLNGPDPAAQATRLREAKRQTELLAQQLRVFFDELTDEKLSAIQAARNDAQDAWLSAREDADKAFVQDAPVRGVGSKSWQRLWEAAREFSSTEAYPDHPFPFIDNDARCVLCQQPLGEDVAARLTHFETFVRGKLQADAKAADKKVDDLLAVLPKDITPQQLDTALTASQLSDNFRPTVRQIAERFSARRNAISGITTPDAIPRCPTKQYWPLYLRIQPNLKAKHPRMMMP